MDGHGTGAAKPRAWSLLLPKSGYKARPKDRSAEEALAREWAEGDRHGAAEAARRGCPEFLLQDGPPYANGPLHAGHALNRLLKDTLLRCRRARGFSAPFVPGWDCHGLPVEWAVEKKLRAEGVLDPKADPAAFRERCREWAAEWMGRQAETMKRLGVLADWRNAWSTMSPGSDAATARRLHAFLAAGRLKRADRPVRWSVPEGTALAEAEVEHEDAEHRPCSSASRWSGAKALPCCAGRPRLGPWPATAPSRSPLRTDTSPRGWRRRLRAPS